MTEISTDTKAASGYRTLWLAPWTVRRRHCGEGWALAWVSRHGCLAGALAAFMAFSLMGAPAAATNPITTFQQFYNLPRDQTQARWPVAIRGVVLCIDAGWNQLYVHDGHHTAWFNPKQFQTQPETGQQVEITGTCAVVEGQPTYADLQLTLIGHGILPAAIPLELPDLARHFGQRIETRGRVRVVDTSLDRLTLVIHEHNQSSVVYVLGLQDTNDARRLLNGKVRIRGINGSKTANGKLESAIVYVPGFNEIDLIEKPSAKAPPPPVVSIGGLVGREPGAWTNQPVHLNGLISAYEPGSSLMVRDPTGAMRAQVVQKTLTPLDARVDVYGFPRITPTEVVLSDAYFVVTATPAPQAAAPSAPTVAARAADLSGVLTNVVDISKLRRAEASRRIPVRLRGVVTYADPDWRVGFFQDPSGAIYFELGQPDIHSGHWVELTGVTGPGGFAPEVRETAIRVLGTTNLPAPAKVALEDLADGHLDSHWIEVEGVVRQVSGSSGHVTLSLVSRRGPFEAVIPVPSDQPLPTQLVDALVSVPGACTSVTNARGQWSGITQHTPRLDMVRVLEGAPADPFAMATTPIEAVATFAPDRLAGRRVKLQGQVTLKIPGQGFMLQDATAGIRVHTPQTNEVQAGDWLEVLGFPSLGDFSPGLEQARFHQTGSRPPPAGVKTTAAQILRHGTNDGMVVELEARLVQSVPRSVNPQLVLQDDPIIFTARLETPVPGRMIAALRSGSRVRLTGICSIQGDQQHQPRAFSLRLRRPEDLRLLEAPPWWTLGHALVLAGGLALAIVAALAWIALLRRQVRAKTAVIRQKLQDEIAMEARYRELFENANDLLFTIDMQGRCTAVNRAVEHFFGLSREQAIQKPLAEFVAPELQTQIAGQTRLLMAGAVANRLEVKARRGDGKWADLDFRLRVIQEHGRRTGIQVTARDVTERKEFAESLAREKNLLATLLDHLPDNVFVKDTAGRYLLTNLAHTRFHGAVSREHFLGKSAEDLFPAELARQYVRGDRVVLDEGGSVFDEEALLKDSQGGPRCLLTTKVPLKDGAGKVIGVVGISRDITERKKTQTELLRAFRLAGMAEVATGILHNVGNVLNSVNVSTTLVTDRLQLSKIPRLVEAAALLRDHTGDMAAFLTLDAKGKCLPKYLADVAEHLAAERTALLTEMASLTKNVAHVKEIVAMQQSYARISGAVESLAAADLMEDAIQMHAAGFQRHHIEVVREYQAVPPVRADRHKVLQILLNLLSNAKYAVDKNDASPEKRLVLGIVRNGADRIVFSVTDTGVGIAPENTTRIFSHGFTTKQDGHGFGLHLGALAAREMGGALSAFSEGVGRGARFQLELPVAKERPRQGPLGGISPAPVAAVREG